MSGGRSGLLKPALRVSVPHTPPLSATTGIDQHCLHCRAMKMLSWLKKTNNDSEVGTSSSARHRRCRSATPPSCFFHNFPPPPRLEDYEHRQRVVIDLGEGCHQNRLCVSVLECERRWREEDDIDHHDVSLPSGGHLNRERVPSR
jgi:hypothetical protein